ncbi:MAG: hypothetical protein EOS20_32180 [Mesorhizobium sp.]|uniref:transposase n=1 Tax=Mesorhizobium sp. TaxID=1871066 RepID=UPI000FE8A0C4|nr:transposase [Mesorhizobium sp.]RWQ29986.1 MAG: hypothetical protein EOS20_32180 [Mesorhizobium sp.]
MIAAVSERLEGALRHRRRYSDEFKARAVAETLQPGVSAIVHRIGIHPSQLFGWRVIFWINRAYLRDVQARHASPAICSPLTG